MVDNFRAREDNCQNRKHCDFADDCVNAALTKIKKRGHYMRMLLAWGFALSMVAAGVGCGGSQTAPAPVGVVGAGATPDAAPAPSFPPYLLDNLRRDAAGFGFELSAIGLEVYEAETASTGVTILRLQQVEQGLPVLNNRLAAHFDAAGKLLDLRGRVTPLGEVSGEPRLDGGRAESIALASMPESSAWRSEAVRLLFYAADSGRPSLAYEVTVRRGLFRKFVLVDAITGEILHCLEGSPSAVRP